MTPFDAEPVYKEINDLAVEIDFQSDFGFPYLRQKLGETQNSQDRATELEIRLTKLVAAAKRASHASHELFLSTRHPAHRHDARNRKAVLTDLHFLMRALRLRKEALNGNFMTIRTYLKAMEQDLKIGWVPADARHTPLPQFQRPEHRAKNEPRSEGGDRDEQ